MSETDDTDELLLIPPDSFISNPELDRELNSFGSYYNVVDSLISQVNKLENRINSIENSSEFSDFSSMNSPRKMYSTSTQSTPQKPRNKFTMNSLPNSPMDRTQKTQKVEIDNFISNVKLIKRLNTVRNLESEFTNSVKHNLDINQVNELLKEVELEEKTCTQAKTWQPGENVNTVPDYGYGMRKNMYEGRDKTDSDSSSESTQMTAFDKFKYKRREDGIDLGLVSLAKLWSSSDGSKEVPHKFQQKLEEERLRRQHCEQAIQDLQNRVLELQERVAVAVEVDEAKDKAILRFHESWEKAGARLQDIEKQKERLEEEIEKLRSKLNEDSSETHQKISHYEKEASLALNIAHSSQDKLAALEKKYHQLEAELTTAQTNSEEFQKKYLEEVEKNKQYPEILAQKELELNDCKTVLAEARREVSQSKRAVEACQCELKSMKSENDALQSKLEAEKENSKKMGEQKSKLLEEINVHKSIAKGLQEELTKARQQMESNKIELKNFYQGQVELVVQSKLKEFQKQLDDAEKGLKEELSKKELSIAKTAASHIQQISEKHSLEIKLLEEKHQEEGRLYQLQISQLRHELNDSNLKIKRQNDKHVHIEKQLHKFMESLRQDHFTSLDEVNSFRSKSFNNIEEILSFNMAAGEEERNRKAELDDSQISMRETPLTSKNERGRRREGSIQETIQMLLDKKGQGDVDGQFYQKMRDAKGKPPWK